MTLAHLKIMRSLSRTMAKSPSSFEERLARIAQNQDAPGDDTPPTPSPEPTLPRGRPPSDMPPLMRSLLTVVMVLAAVVGYLFLSSEENGVASMRATAQAEHEGRTTIGTLLSSANDMLPDLALGYANSRREDLIQANIDSGEWTPEQAQRARAALKAQQGKSSVDMVRDSIRSMIVFEAQTAGQGALGQEYVQKLDNCRSMGCVSVTETQFKVALQAATQG